jgi:hypothetical protein
MLLKYKSELTGRVVEIIWSDKPELFEEEIRIAFGGKLYNYGEDWLSVFNEEHEEVFILQ